MIEVERLRVVVLDDDRFCGFLHEKLLRKLGFADILIASNVSELIGLLSDKPEDTPDLILLDLNMPDMDGVEFLRILGDTGFDGGLILVSGEGEQMLQTAELLAKRHSIDVLGHQKKPLDFNSLTLMIEAWVDKVTPIGARSVLKAYDANELKRAMSDGQLINHYQPKVSVDTGEYVGAEALVRWNHPKDGLIYPEQFISLAEESGLISDLTLVVFEQALRDAWAWREMNLKPAVNVSMDNLNDLGLPDRLLKLVENARIDPWDIVLEITESRLMRNVSSALDIVTRLRLKGFTLAIDDFGLGHSSMAQLRDLPFNQLKVDGSFVHRAHSNPTAQAIYTAARTMASDLGMDFVAEGVEDMADWIYLRQTNCSIAQGYFIAEAMPLDELGKWYERWRTRYQGNFDGE